MNVTLDYILNKNIQKSLTRLKTQPQDPPTLPSQPSDETQKILTLLNYRPLTETPETLQVKFPNLTQNQLTIYKILCQVKSSILHRDFFYGQKLRNVFWTDLGQLVKFGESSFFGKNNFWRKIWAWGTGRLKRSIPKKS